jgi:hypothetical protein
VESDGLLVDRAARTVQRRRGRDPAQPVHLLTELGMGYRFRP